MYIFNQCYQLTINFNLLTIMKKNLLLQLVVVCLFVFSCSKDTFEKKLTDDNETRLATDQFDDSYFGVYKGMFTTNDGFTRGSVVLSLYPNNEGTAQVTLSTGEIVELKSRQPKLTLDNTISDLVFSSTGLSSTDMYLKFSVEEDGLNPAISSVTFDNQESNIFIAKNLSRAPVSPITGTYMRSSGGGSFPISGRTWNVMSIGAGNDQNFAVQIWYGGVIYNIPAGNSTQSGCTTTDYATCSISGSGIVSGYPVAWTGTHKYNPGNASNENQCAEVVGTWTSTYGNSTGTFVSDANCSGPAVSNNSCEGAIAISAGSHTGSNLNATSAGAPSGCADGLANGRGVWYTYTPSADKSVIIDTEGTTFAPNDSPDTKLGLFSGTCGALTCIDSDDDGAVSGLLSSITFNASANVTYYIYLTGYDNTNDFGDFTLNISEFDPPANDLCANATPVTLGSPVNGVTTFGSNTGAPETNCNGVNLRVGPGVWHTYTNSTGSNKLIRANTVGSNFNTRLGVFSGTCGALSCVTANNNGPTEVAPQSQLSFTAAPGMTYYLYVTAASGVSGNYTLNLNEILPPVNDVCSGAVSIACGGSITIDNSNATAVDRPTDTCGTSSGTGPGMWYSFSTPSAKTVNINTTGSVIADTKLNVYSGSCGSLVCVGGNDDIGFSNYLSSYTFVATANTPYLIYVSGYDEDEVGTFNLNITCTDPFSLTPSCGESLIDNGADTSTPGNYANNSNDTYTIDAGVGNRVSLNFTTFNTEQNWDSMRIYNGQTVGSNEITSVNGRVIYVNTGTPSRTGFCGTGAGANSLQGQTVVSSGRYLTITFKSDGSATRVGFQAQVTCIPARMVSDSHIRTSESFMPAASPSTPKARVSESRVSEDYDRKKLELYRRQKEKENSKIELNASQNREENDSKPFKKFTSEAQRMEYNKKHNIKN